MARLSRARDVPNGTAVDISDGLVTVGARIEAKRIRATESEGLRARSAGCSGADRRSPLPRLFPLRMVCCDPRPTHANRKLLNCYEHRW